jgi:hypothetical protein
MDIERVKIVVLFKKKAAYLEPVVPDGICESKLALNCQLPWMPSL